MSSEATSAATTIAQSAPEKPASIRPSFATNPENGGMPAIDQVGRDDLATMFTELLEQRAITAGQASVPALREALRAAGLPSDTTLMYARSGIESRERLGR